MGEGWGRDGGKGEEGWGGGIRRELSYSTDSLDAGVVKYYYTMSIDTGCKTTCSVLLSYD